MFLISNFKFSIVFWYSLMTFSFFSWSCLTESVFFLLFVTMNFMNFNFDQIGENNRTKTFWFLLFWLDIAFRSLFLPNPRQTHVKYFKFVNDLKSQFRKFRDFVANFLCYLIFHTSEWEITNTLFRNLFILDDLFENF